MLSAIRQTTRPPHSARHRERRPARQPVDASLFPPVREVLRITGLSCPTLYRRIAAAASRGPRTWAAAPVGGRTAPCRTGLRIRRANQWLGVELESFPPSTRRAATATFEAYRVCAQGHPHTFETAAVTPAATDGFAGYLSARRALSAFPRFRLGHTAQVVGPCAHVVLSLEESPDRLAASRL